MRPSRLGILVLAAGLVPAALPAIAGESLWPFWTAYCAAMVLLFGLDAILTAPAGHIRVELFAPETLYVGEPAEARAAVAVSRRGVPAVEVGADFSEELVAQPPVKLACPPQGVEVRIPLVSRRRGTAVVEGLWVRYPGRLGLLELRRSFILGRRIAVVPNIVPAQQAALRAVTERTFLGGLRIERYKGDGTEFDSLRAFVEGDDTRTIHWRASARHKTLLCRQFRAERDHQVVLAVDSGYLMCEPLAGGLPKIDHAVSSALLLAFVCLRSGDRVGLFTFDERARIFAKPEGGMGHFRTLTHLSSLIEYSRTETNFTLGLTTLSQKLQRRSLVVMLTDFVDTITAELMVENLGRLARKHVVVFVGLRDPDLQRLAGARPDTALDLNRAVVAHSYLAERHVVLKRLARLGLLTIDAEPAQVRTELINKYLYVKRRELV